jgi:hypothetical protein
MYSGEFLIIEKEFDEVPKLFYGYRLSYKSWHGSYDDCYIVMMCCIRHKQYFDKAREYGAYIMSSRIEGDQAIFKIKHDAKLFLEWVQSIIILNKLSSC